MGFAGARTGCAAPPAVPRRSPPVPTEAASLPAPAERCRDMCCPAVAERGTALLTAAAQEA